VNRQNVWTITAKDLWLFRKKKTILYSALILPLGLSIGLPMIAWYVVNNRNVPIQVLFPIFDAFSFFFLVLAAIIPTVIGSYSFVGEKTEKTLEPLLATPTTDDEILLGKSLAAFLPVIVMIFIGAVVFTVLMDIFTFAKVGYLYFPNWNFIIIVLLNSPLASIMSIEFSVLVSSRVNDIRSAQQLAALIIIPFFALYLLTEISVITLDTNTLLLIGGIIALIDIGLFFANRVIFQREEILTKWK
jgi:ABC-type transport system involved in multi-copper enzyme maturation permease subunit